MHKPKPIAIRSLQCADHAVNIPPQVLSVMWFLGKRCNYDCSYCSPHVHDAVSPFVDQSAAEAFCQGMHSYCQQNGKKTKWSFTGGEPFIDPGFLPLVENIKKLSSTEQLNVTTNGSLPLKIYQQASRWVDGITISLHLERGTQEIDSIINNISQISNCFVTVNLMFLPGRLHQIQDIMSRLQRRDIAFVLRKITPPVQQADLVPYRQLGRGRKARALVDLDQQSDRKIQWRLRQDDHRAAELVQYYDLQEQQLLSNANHQIGWNNCGVWYDDGSYQEINSDLLVSQDLNSFRDWQCWAGTDNLYIDFDGQIYRALCQDGGSLGHITRGWSFQSSSHQCQTKWCICNSDIAIRKATQQGLDHVNS